MKRILVALALTAVLSSRAFATLASNPDEPTLPIITNVFATQISESSGTMPSVRVGLSGIEPMVALNVPGSTPVMLSNVAGVLQLNGVPITTDTISGTDIAVSQDLSVGRDSAITRNETIGGTLGVTGASTLAALSATTIDASSNLSVAGASYLGAAATKSTVAANGSISGFSSIAAATSLSAGTSVSATTTVTAGTNIIATAGFFRLYSRTLAQIMALTPAAIGEMYICSDCTPVEVAVSTGVGAPNTGGFGNTSGAQLD